MTVTETRMSNELDSATDFMREFAEFKKENNLEIDSLRVLGEINKILRGKKFDSWSTWISRVSTGITEVSAGDTIYGWYFITLQDKLNQWIASL